MQSEAINIIHDKLAVQGWLVLHNQAEEDLAPIIDQLGRVIYTTDVIIKPESRALITSEKSLYLHTDHHKAKYIAWYCYQQTDSGGETLLLNAESAYQQLSPAEQKELESIYLFEHKVFPDDSDRYPLVTQKNGSRQFYYSFWLVNETDKDRASLQHFHEIIRISKPLTLKLVPKDILIVDNHRVLHGRNAISGSKDRFLKRYWIN